MVGTAKAGVSEVAGVHPSYHRRRRISRILVYLGLAVSGLCFSFPLFYVVSGSLQTWQELQSYVPHLLPRVPQWHNYLDVNRVHPFLRWMLNSFLIIGLAVPGELITALVCAYGFSRFEFRGREVWFIIMLGTMMVPFQVLLIPQYLLFHRLGWVNTYVPLILPAWLGGSPFAVFLLRQFIMSIPRDLDEAALIDGAGTLSILFRVLLPLMTPAMTTLAILSFLSHWNAFMGPLVYLQKYETYTAAVGLRFFQTAMQGGYFPEPRDHLLMAASAMMAAPAILVFVLAQRHFVQGVVMTGIKM
jgi:multiple sugar transport system permease protein